MLPKFPDLSTLPIEQQIIAWIALSLIAILAIFVTRYAFKNGQISPKEKDKGEIVALSIDTGALGRATAAVEGLTMSVVALNLKLERTADGNAQLREHMKDLTKEVADLANQIDFLGRLKK